MQQVSRRDIYVTTGKILLQLFSIWASYVSLSNYILLILTFYTVPVRLHDVNNVVNQNALSSKHVSIFLPRKYDVISQLRHSYAKGPFCVTRLIWFLVFSKIDITLIIELIYNAHILLQQNT